MTQQGSNPRFELTYWPLPFRGCFVSYLFAWRDVPLLEKNTFDDVLAIKDLSPEEQPIPFMGPPVFTDIENGVTLSQMPAIVLYAADELDLLPDSPADVAMAVKILMDCNDLLMEICRYNGSIMWERAEWREFRSQRLPQWLRIFEQSLARNMIGNEPVTFADIAVFALFGNMMRCLPELDGDVREHAAGVHELCASLGAKPSLAAFVAQQEDAYGQLYCGGHIEESIRAMLALDEEDSRVNPG